MQYTYQSHRQQLICLAPARTFYASNASPAEKAHSSSTTISPALPETAPPWPANWSASVCANLRAEMRLAKRTSSSPARRKKVSSALGKERDRSKRTVGAVARLRAAEVGPERMSEPEVNSCGMIPASGTADAPDGTESAKATPEVAGLCTPVEGFFVQEVRHNDRVDDGDEVVGDSGKPVARKGARVSSRDQRWNGDGLRLTRQSLREDGSKGSRRRACSRRVRRWRRRRRCR